VIVTRVANSFDYESAYVYVWITKERKSVYVGQTSGDGGVVGRAGAHVKSNGTLRERFYEAYGEQIECAEDWYILTFPLPKKKKYTGPESSYRNAVEYLVQTGLNEVRGSYVPPFRVISNICYSDRCSEPDVRAIAKSILSAIEEVFPTIK